MACLQLLFKMLDPLMQPSSIPLQVVKVKILSHPFSAVLPASHPSLSTSEAVDGKASTETISVIGFKFLLASKYLIVGLRSTLVYYQSDSLCWE